jgi:hypothetical protein
MSDKPGTIPPWDPHENPMVMEMRKRLGGLFQTIFEGMGDDTNESLQNAAGESPSAVAGAVSGFVVEMIQLLGQNVGAVLDNGIPAGLAGNDGARPPRDHASKK